MNLESGLKTPSDGWDCNPIDGQGSLIIIAENATYNGDVKNCLPTEGGKATVITNKGHVFVGTVYDNAARREGKYTASSNNDNLVEI